VNGYTKKGGLRMEGRHIILAGIWAFTLILLIGFFMTGTSMEFLGYLILFFIAFVFSLITEFLLVKK
jgi:hypothetical protein